MKNPKNLEVPEARISLTGNKTWQDQKYDRDIGLKFSLRMIFFCDDTLDPNNFLWQNWIFCDIKIWNCCLTVSNRHVRCPIVVVYDSRHHWTIEELCFISNCSLSRVFCDMSQKIQKYSGSPKMLVVGAVTTNITSYFCVPEEFFVTFWCIFCDMPQKIKQ